MNLFARWTLTKTIILINCLIALWSLHLGPTDPTNWIKLWLPLNLPELLAGKWWQVFTCSWVHADLIGFSTLHLIFNMLSLAMLGKIVEDTLGRKHFCLIYFPAGLVAVLFYLVEIYIRAHFFNQAQSLQSSLVGASGCVMGLAVAFATMHPNRLIMIMPWPFPIRAITAIYLFCAVSLLFIFIPYFNFIAHSAHLGGAVWGFIYMRLIGWQSQPKVDPSSIPLVTDEDLISEIAQVDTLSEKDVALEIPSIMRKLQQHGKESLTLRDQAILHKARLLSLI